VWCSGRRRQTTLHFLFLITPIVTLAQPTSITLPFALPHARTTCVCSLIKGQTATYVNSDVSLVRLALGEVRRDEDPSGIGKRNACCCLVDSLLNRRKRVVYRKEMSFKYGNGTL
jgi:hypothetical protein